LTKSIRKKDKFKMTRPQSSEQRQFTVIHPLNVQTAKHFVLSSHAIFAAIEPLIKKNRIDYRECAMTSCQWVN
jgi:hypothetical protein